MILNKEQLTQFIKQKSQELSFLDCGISKSGFLEEEAPRLEKWLKEGNQGKMSYLENHFDKRLNPSLLVDGAKSVISFSYNYYPSETQKSDTYKIAKYAYGEDYHIVIREKLEFLIHLIKEKVGDFSYRVFTDSAPVMERAWAKKSGLGWIGKNSLLLSKQKGSFFFLAEIICDLELEYDSPFKTNHCGSCTRCIDACPTQAIISEKVIDSRKCISYLTIELKDEIGEEFKGKMKDWIFGCDICQDVCPWNRFSKPNTESRFQPSSDLLDFTYKDWEDLEEETFRKIFKHSAIKRAKYSGLKGNINFIKKK
ncbi:tRNA epoxyqueuosine(34) reductase QueG [Apibacter muscae]|uniref:tRNA epoxyqueuosine(34) reductase QueG n=1 Tax=Apibacter muscae TaxID=2509004 RepID=UPI0011AC81A2|nr:tRNA epoxyqueuosine(34) reductase QueG [Apibacter muscae]TWP28056.1 tRNA epoxyqueuosine(34) reductase QueG [Apibacter muscae]